MRFVGVSGFAKRVGGVGGEEEDDIFPSLPFSKNIWRRGLKDWGS